MDGFSYKTIYTIVIRKFNIFVVRLNSIPYIKILPLIYDILLLFTLDYIFKHA